jgi:hypothetical protein
MNKRVIYTSCLLVAFAAVQCGNVLAAAFCPRAASARACCLRHNPHPSQSRENQSVHQMDMGQMADMQMEMPAEPAEETTPRKQSEPLAEVDDNAVAIGLDQPLEPCSHCLNHSQLPLGSGTLRETEAAQWRADAIISELAPQTALVTLPGLIFDPRDHAPPGILSPRYLLINVFRI